MKMYEVLKRVGTRVVFDEPWDEKKEQDHRESAGMSWYKIDGKLPAEIQALKGADGQYNANAVTRQLIVDLMKKYPTVSGLYGIKLQGTSSFETYVTDAQRQLQKALQDSNEFSAPKSRFFYPNRPQPDDAASGFRGDGRTGKVENTAKKFDPSDLRFYMGAVKWAVSRRFIDPIPADQWLMILLTEGRDDFGFNIGQWNEQKSKPYADLEERLKTAGMSNGYQRGFVAIVKSKQDTVKRTGINFYQAWNGGAANLANYNIQAAAVKDPRNKPLLDIIAQALA
jgi:hypothetical protein